MLALWWSRKKIKVPMKEMVTTSRVEIVEIERLFTPFSRRKQIVASVATIIEVAQLCAFAFSPSIPWTDHSYTVTLPDIMQAFVFKFPGNSFRITFWIVIAMVFLGFFLVDLFLQIINRFFKLEADTKNELYSTWYRTFSVCFYANLFAALNCESQTSEPSPFVTINPEIKCWDGLHIAYFVISIITIFAYDAITFSVLKINKVLSEVTSSCIFYDSLYLTLDFRCKMLLVGILTFYSHSGAAVLGCLLVLFTFLVAFQFYFRPCNFEIINIIRLCGFLFVLWATICGTMAWIIKNPTNWLPFLAFVIGSPLLVPLCVVYYRMTSSKFRSSHPAFSEVRFMASDFDESGFESD